MRYFLRILIGVIIIFSLVSGCSTSNEELMLVNENKKEINELNNVEDWILSVPDEVHFEMKNGIYPNKRIDNREKIQHIVNLVNNAIDINNDSLHFFAENEDKELKHIGNISGFDLEIKLFTKENMEVVYLVSAKGVKSIVTNDFLVSEYVPKQIPRGIEPDIDEIAPIPPADGLDNDDIKQLNPKEN